MGASAALASPRTQISTCAPSSASRRAGMPIWRDRLFAVMHRNAAPANAYFRIPGNRLVELGSQVEI